MTESLDDWFELPYGKQLRFQAGPYEIVLFVSSGKRGGREWRLLDISGPAPALIGTWKTFETAKNYAAAFWAEKIDDERAMFEEWIKGLVAKSDLYGDYAKAAFLDRTIAGSALRGRDSRPGQYVRDDVRLAWEAWLASKD